MSSSSFQLWKSRGKKRAEAGAGPHGEPAANQQPVSGLIGATLFRLRPELYLIQPPVVFGGVFLDANFSHSFLLDCAGGRRVSLISLFFFSPRGFPVKNLSRRLLFFCVIVHQNPSGLTDLISILSRQCNFYCCRVVNSCFSSKCTRKTKKKSRFLFFFFNATTEQRQ